MADTSKRALDQIKSEDRRADSARTEAEQLAAAAQTMASIVAPGNPYITNPYVGDWPPAYPPTVPYQPGQGTTTTQLFPSKENKMDVYLIWAITPDQPDAPWVVSAWDAESRSDNEDGFQEDLAKAEKVYGARFIRVTRTSVNYDKVVASFDAAEV